MMPEISSVNFGKFLDFIFLRHSTTIHNNIGFYSKLGILSSDLFVKSPKYIFLDAYQSECASAFLFLVYSDNLILPDMDQF